MEPEIPIDLSLRPLATSKLDKSSSILKPIPKPPWAILWYQNLWPMFGNLNNYSQTTTTTNSEQPGRPINKNRMRQQDIGVAVSSKAKSDNQILGINSSGNFQSDETLNEMGSARQKLYKNIDKGSDDISASSMKGIGENKGVLLKASTGSPFITISDIATCDGPVLFDRVLNPNFAVTVEHHNVKSSSPGSSSPGTTTTANNRSNTYLCICCNQSFKSLFCYQKHKKRHLNPVLVNISSSNVTVSQNKSHTKDLNVQFFPCKKCGCKFPSYYFVHKHKKSVCHDLRI